METSGFKAGQGLGANLQGIINPVKLIDNTKRFGLGYEPSIKEEFAKKASLK